MTKNALVIESWIAALEEGGRGLSKWEEQFLESIRDQFDRWGTVSDRQEEILERIYAEKTR